MGGAGVDHAYATIISIGCITDSDELREGLGLTTPPPNRMSTAINVIYSER